MRRAAVLHAALAALATLGAATALRAVSTGDDWIARLLLVELLVLVIGCVLRWARSPIVVTALMQLAGALWFTGHHYLGATYRHHLPTLRTLPALARQLDQALHLIFTYRAPLAPDPALDLTWVLAMLATGVVVDAVATRRRMPVAAGVPLVWPLATAAVARPDVIGPVPFLLTAVPWLGLLGTEGFRRTRGWSSVTAEVTTPTLDTQDRRGLERFGRLGRASALAAVLVAALLPSMVPLGHLDVTGGDGGGTGGGQAGASAGPARVSFVDTLDLSKDLGDRSGTPVLRYRVNDADPPPLKIYAVSQYENGLWRKPNIDTAPEAFQGRVVVPPPAGLDEAVPRESYTMRVEENLLQAPYVAIPAYATGLRPEGAPTTFRYDPAANHLVVGAAPARYVATYLTARPRTAPTATVIELDPSMTSETLRFEGPFVPAVREETRIAIGTARTPLAQALAMQAYLRRPANYRYSLTLAPAPDAPDMLTAFIRTRQGYCAQFASLMTMMARSQGIPARVAYGFLPGRLDSDGRRIVTRADAHAWPELYIPQLGWVRFEPTPATRTGDTPPTYQADQRPTSSPTRDPRPTSRPTATATEVPPAPPVGGGAGAHLRVSARLAALLLGALALAALLATRPVLAARLRRQARSDAADLRVEDVWASLLARLGDLGIDTPPADSPQTMGGRLGRALTLEGADAAALDRVVDALEGERYRRPGTAAADMGTLWGDHDAVVRAARREASRVQRARAFLWPRDLATLRLAVGQARER